MRHLTEKSSMFVDVNMRSQSLYNLVGTYIVLQSLEETIH